MNHGDTRHATVAVLGGGPAGCAAARFLALWGHDVVLLTRPAPGPPLAESLTPSCARLLDRLGVLNAMEGARFVRSTGHTVRWGGGAVRSEPFADGQRGWQVRRDQFDQLLLRQAKSAGVQVHRHAGIRRVTAEDHGVRIRYEERGQTQELAAQWAIDCTGRAGLMSRADSGREGRSRRTLALVATWEHRGGWDLDDYTHTLVESTGSGWAWSVPLTRTRRQVTMMLDPERSAVAAGGRLQLTYRSALAATTMIRMACDRARLVGSPWARDASSYACSEVARGCVLIAGDAASFVDPLSSYGVKKALASAWLAAVAVNTVLGDGTLRDPAVGLFAARERAMVRALESEMRELAADAAGARSDATSFWDDRRDALEAPASGEPDVAALRDDPEVRAAFDRIRAIETLTLRLAPGATRTAGAFVKGDRVVVDDHLVNAAFPAGVRFLRNVDLVALEDVALRHAGVPRMYDAYCRAVMPVDLPDFLGALSVLVGKNLMQVA